MAGERPSRQARQIHASSAVRDDRRRASRRRLQPAVEVRLCGLDFSPTESVHGSLLNASHLGLACRVTGDQLDRVMRFGKVLRVAFQLAGDSWGFNLLGRLVNMTPASSPDEIVLGLEFLEEGNPPAEVERFRKALEQAGTEEG